MIVRWRIFLDNPCEVSSWRSWIFNWFHWGPMEGSVTTLRVLGVSVHRYRYREFKT
jgi:hypothetical protein